MSSKNEYAVCIFAASYLLLEAIEEDEEPKKKRRNIWVKPWIEKRNVEGCFAKLLPELRNTESKQYSNFLRMCSNDFDFLLDLVTPLIKKKDTQMRKSIPSGERLALTLRFLATGDSFKSLQYLFRIPQSTISVIIPDVLDAIYTVLKENYLKVRIYFKLFFYF